MARLSGKGGAAFVATTVIESCEDAWNEQVVANVTSTLDNTDYQIGSGSAKFVLAAGVGLEIIGSEAFAAQSISTSEDILCWIKSSVALNAGDFQLLLDDTADCASPLETIDIPALSASTWAYVSLPLANPSTDLNLISVGLQQAVDKGALTLHIDDVRASEKIAGIKSWTLDQSTATEDVTGFDSGGFKNHVPTVTGWAGSFEGFKDGAPLSTGSIVGLELQESTTSTQTWKGSAILNSRNSVVDVSDVVRYSYNFTGIHELVIPTA